MEMRDCSLVREAQHGHQAAFAKLVHTYDRTVVRLAHPGPAECALCKEIASLVPRPFIPRGLVARVRALVRGASQFGVAITLTLCALSSTHAHASVLEDTPGTVATLEAKADQAQPRDKCFLYARLVSEMTDLAGSELTSGDSRRAWETLMLVQQYAEKIHTGAANDSKKLKQAEVLVQRTSFRLKDILGGASFEDREILETTLKQLNQVEAQLMAQVFEK